MNIKVQLRHDVPPLGRAGQIVNVSQAYARNFLVPKGLAVLATAKVIAVAAQTSAARVASNDRLKADLEKIRGHLHGAKVMLSGRASPAGKLFAAIKAEHIIRALQRDYQVVLPSTVSLNPETLKTVGDHPVMLKIGSDTISFTVHIDHAET